MKELKKNIDRGYEEYRKRVRRMQKEGKKITEKVKKNAERGRTNTETGKEECIKRERQVQEAWHLQNLDDARCQKYIF